MNAPVSYLKLSDGSTFIPIGVNLCFPRFINSREEGLAVYRRWIDQLSANGGNFFRIFLGHPFFDFEGDRCGDFRPELTTALREVLDMAAASGVKVKVTFDHFRSIAPEPVAEIFPGAAKFDKSKYHVAVGGVAENMTDYLAGEGGRRHFLSKLDFFARHFGNHPALFAVELWNEMNAVGAGNWAEWTEFMLPELRRRFPHLLCLQSLGSHCRPENIPTYEWLARLPGLECVQVHRYIDELPGHFPLCSGPTDILAASSMREMRAIAPERALILAESGAVDPGHRAPFSDYPKDTAGGILHDVLFAPFFAGSAGCGQCWHWDFYLDKNNLWHHFLPFAAMVDGLDPAAEGFVPHFSENARFRAYELRGKTVRLHWLRDAAFDWKAELRDGQSAPLQDSGKWLPPDFLPRGQWEFLDPWESSPRWKSTDADPGGVALPQWRRSIILRQRTSKDRNYGARENLLPDQIITPKVDVKKRITLIGDSIRIGYQAMVRELLADRADIWSPEGNCMHSLHHLFNIQPWYVDPAADIIHFNFGLWDCRRLERGNADNAVPVEVFTRNLDFILRKVRAATTARIIWATITPVVQDRYNARFSLPQDPCREASDVELYNAAAAPVLLRHGIPVNDLHAFVEEHGRERLICDDGIHYTEHGSRLLGEQVAKVLTSHL